MNYKRKKYKITSHFYEKIKIQLFGPNKIIICPICNKNIIVRNYNKNKKYCSHKCYIENKRNNNNV